MFDISTWPFLNGFGLTLVHFAVDNANISKNIRNVVNDMPVNDVQDVVDVVGRIQQHRAYREHY